MKIAGAELGSLALFLAHQQKRVTFGSTFSAVNFISPPILSIYIALGCCVAKRLFVQKWFKR